MVICLDHVWRLKFRGVQAALHKNGFWAGEKKEFLENKSGKARHVTAFRSEAGKVALNPVRTILGVQPVHAADRLESRKRKWSSLTDKEFTRVAVHDERLGYTNVTSWWGNGDPGPLVYIFPEDAFKPSEINAANKKYSPELFVMTSGKNNNHFADAENNIRMQEVIC